MSILDKIVAQKKVEIEKLPRGEVVSSQIRAALKARGGLRPFGAALENPLFSSVGLIAEIKKASPSAGVICPDFDPIRIARLYELGGASCLSVLTDEQFFQGSLDYLQEVRKTVKLPLLRKDFILHSQQILEAVEWGADAILLIVAILSDEQLRHLVELCKESGIDALVEVHDVPELHRAVAAGAQIIGINNRDLKTFKVDLSATEKISAALAKASVRPRLLVAESGIHTRQDVIRVEAAGARAILVGESLMRQTNIPGKVRELLGIQH